MPNGQKRQVALFTSRKTIANQFANSNHHRGEFDQLLSDFEYFAPELSVSIYPDDDRDMNTDVVIMTYGALDNMDARTHQGKFSLCLLDEAHNIGPKRLQSLNELAANELVVGLTGTPGQLKHKIPEEIDSVTVPEGILDYKFLSSALIKVIQTRFFHSSQHASNKTLAADTARNEQLVDVIASWTSQYGVGFVKSFNTTQATGNHAKLLAEMACDRDIVDRDGVARRLRVEAVGHFRKDSADIIQAFAQGTHDADALIAPRILNEGVNVPRLNWALWTHPTADQDGIGQFFGRGLRIDPHNPQKIFVFGQTLDTERGRWGSRQPHYVWHNFGIEEPPVDDLYVGPIERRPGNFLGQHLRSAREMPVKRNIIDDLTSEVDIELSLREMSLVELSVPDESESDKLVHSLTSLENQFSMDRSWLRTILGDTGFTARIRCIDGSIDYWYEEDSISVIRDSVAHPDDKFTVEIAKEAGMSADQVLSMASEEGIEIIRLYPRVERPSNFKLLYALRAIDYQRLAQRDRLPQPLQPHEIDTAEIAQRIDFAISSSNLTLYLYSRGYKLHQRRVLGSRAKDKWLGDRNTIEAWIDAYRNAPPLIPGYSPVSSFCWQVRLRVVIEAARISGVTIHLFTSEGAVSEYIHSDDTDTLKNAIKQRGKDLSEQIPTSPRLHKLSLQEHTLDMLAALADLPEEIVSREQHELGIPLDKSGHLSPLDYEKLRLRLLRIRRELDAVKDEPALRVAIAQCVSSPTLRAGSKAHTSQPVEQPSLRPAPSKEQLAIFNDSREYVRLLLPIAKHCEQSSRLLRVVLERHDTLREVAKSKTEIDDELSEALISLLNRNKQLRPTIPESWLFIGDLADELGMSEHALLQLFVGKKIHKEHFRVMEIRGVNGWIGFCSVELANMLRQHRENLKQRQT